MITTIFFIIGLWVCYTALTYKKTQPRKSNGQYDKFPREARGRRQVPVWDGNKLVKYIYL